MSTINAVLEAAARRFAAADESSRLNPQGGVFSTAGTIGVLTITINGPKNRQARWKPLLDRLLAHPGPRAVVLLDRGEKSPSLVQLRAWGHQWAAEHGDYPFSLLHLYRHQGTIIRHRLNIVTATPSGNAV